MKSNKITQLCECNCGEYANPGNRYILGHNVIGKPSPKKGKGKQLSPAKLCGCGCGEYTKPGNVFIQGHQNKGRVHGPMSEEQKQKRRGPKSEQERLKIKEIANRPEVRLARSKAVKKFYSDPENRKANSLRQKEAMNRQEVKEKISKSLKITNAKPEVKKRRSESANNVWKDEELRKRHSKIQKKVQNTPEARKANSIRSKECQNRPEVRIKKSKIVKKFFANPENRKANSDRQKEAQNRPEVKERRIKSQIELWKDLDYKRKQLIAIGKGLGILPNKPETTLMELLNWLYPGHYKYVGDFSFVIAGKCPDFININDQKKIIELFGDYWHKGEDPQNRIDLFKVYGYDTLVIWEHELEDIERVKFRIHKFHEKEKV